MKNVLKLNFQITDTPIYFCYGRKSYNKAVKKYFELEDSISETGTGISTMYRFKGVTSIIIGVSKIKSEKYFRRTVIHELSYAVSQIMDNYDIKCDEFRSYALEWLYWEVMEFLNDVR